MKNFRDWISESEAWKGHEVWKKGTLLSLEEFPTIMLEPLIAGLRAEKPHAVDDDGAKHEMSVTLLRSDELLMEAVWKSRSLHMETAIVRFFYDEDAGCWSGGMREPGLHKGYHPMNVEEFLNALVVEGIIKQDGAQRILDSLPAWKEKLRGKITGRKFGMLESDSSSPYHYESFLEKYGDNVIYDMEKRLASEGFKIDPDSFWQDLEDLKLYDDFENDLEALVSNFTNELYFKEYFGNEEDSEYTEEYLRIRKEWRDHQSSSKALYFRESDFEKRLMRNAIEKNWEAWKAFYKKWLDLVHSKRGQLTAKKFNM